MRKHWKLLIVILLAAFLVAPVNGQEATETPTAEPPPVVVPPASDTVQLTWTALVGLITIVLTTGLTGGVAGAVIVVRTVRQNDVVKDAIEKLYLSTPPTTQEQIRKLVELVLEGGGLLDEVTDGKP